MLTLLKIIVKIIKSRILKEQFKINFEITSKCNSKCTHCQKWQNSKKDLTTKEIITFIRKIPNNYFWISITGGEPFGRKDLKQIMEAILKKKNIHLVSINTNGTYRNQTLNYLKQISSHKTKIFEI